MGRVVNGVRWSSYVDRIDVVPCFEFLSFRESFIVWWRGCCVLCWI
jgi:hypothetical protein